VSTDAISTTSAPANVFAAMGFADAGERLAKAELAKSARKSRAADGWTRLLES
jgi:hypothetical protein